MGKRQELSRQDYRIYLKDGKLCTFISIKTYRYFYFELYLNILTNYQHRFVITKFQISAHRLKVKIGRYKKIPKEDRICTHSDKNDVHGEINFLLGWSHLKLKRHELIDLYITKFQILGLFLLIIIFFLDSNK